MLGLPSPLGGKKTRADSPTPFKPPSGGMAGFALIEMMLALALMALLAALALPRARTFDGGAALRTKAYQAAALLRADRDAAHRANRLVETTIDSGRRALRSGATGDLVLFPDAVALRWAGEGGRGILFYADGRASGGVLGLSAGARRLTIEVDPFTAAVAIRSPGGAAP